MSKRTNKFDYPHPLIKHLGRQKHFTEQNLAQFLKEKPTFYENNYTFSPQIKTTISPKLLRLSNTKITPDEKFGILMQPFNESQEVELLKRPANDSQNWRCCQCQSFFNSQSESVSLYEVKCRVCQHVQSISLEAKHSLQNIPGCYDICTQDLSDTNQTSIEKNICFVVEASEFNYNYKVNEVIESCVNALRQTMESEDNLTKKVSETTTEDDENGGMSQHEDSYTVQTASSSTQPKPHYNIGFIMFNDKHIYVINQSTHDVMVFNESFIESFQPSQSHNILAFDDLFKPINEVSEETFGMVSDILYESYLTSTSCLDVATRFINGWVDRYDVGESEKAVSGNGLNQNSLPKKQQKRQIEFKFFVNALKFTSSKVNDENVKVSQQDSTSGLGSINPRQIFSNVTNIFTSSSSNTTTSAPSSKSQSSKPSSSSLPSSPSVTQPLLLLSPNFSFFYLPHYHTTTFHTLSQQQVLSKLNNNLYRMYPQTEDQTTVAKLELFNQMYYDLFQAMGGEQYYEVKVKVVTSEKVEVLAVGNGSLGYRDSVEEKVVGGKQAATTGNKKFNSYTITMNCLHPTTTLPIDLTILPSSSSSTLKSSSQTKHFIEIHLEYTKPLLPHPFTLHPQPITFTRVFHTEVTSLNRAINYNHHIYASLSTYVDDETLFYFKLRWIFAQAYKTKTNHTILKKLRQQMQKISEQFKDQYGQIDFHKEYVRIFLYAFMVVNRAMVNGINENFHYERHLWVNSSMEQMSKSLYPRTYQILPSRQDPTKPCLKNIKTAPKSFKTDSLLLLDNGKQLYMIIGEDTTVQDMKLIFGTCFMHEIREMTELPELETNQYYRELIDLARAQHQSNYLQLRIVELFSSEFEDQVGDLLYIKDSHYKYMRELWEMKPLVQKVRS